jgi:hypothetical protein
MAHGYVSDAVEQTVMDKPDCEVVIDPDQLNREQAVTLGQLGMVDDEAAFTELQSSGRGDPNDIGFIRFHFTLQEAVTMLQLMDVIPSENADSVIEDE